MRLISQEVIKVYFKECYGGVENDSKAFIKILAISI